MKQKKVIIIGAGIAGLCAGCYLQMNNYDTEIMELHDIPGGLCTAWKRGDYTFDGCLHWLVGSSPSDNYNRLWNEIIDLNALEFINHDSFFKFISSDGKELNFYVDTERLEKELKSKAPEDTDLIDSMIKAIEKLKGFDTTMGKPPELQTIVDKLQMNLKILPYIGLFKKFGSKTIYDLGMQAKNPLFKKVLTYDPLFKELSIFVFLFGMAWFSKRSAGYPIGGSLKFIELFEKRYRSLGGNLKLNSRVKKIVVEDNIAKGIILENGEKHDADIVISAADGYSTVYEMLEGKYTTLELDKLYSNQHDSIKPFPSMVYISLGVTRTFDEVCHSYTIETDTPFRIDDSTELNAIGACIYNFDSTLAPQGKTPISVMMETYGHKYWLDMKKNNINRYKAEKERIANQAIDILDRTFGDIKQKVEVVDVATPATFIQYTNNWQGSYEGWLLTPGSLNYNISKTLPGLQNFYMIGQWVVPGGGLPSGLSSARTITQIICKKDRKRFKVDT